MRVFCFIFVLYPGRHFIDLGFKVEVVFAQSMVLWGEQWSKRLLQQSYVKTHFLKFQGLHLQQFGDTFLGTPSQTSLF